MIAHTQEPESPAAGAARSTSRPDTVAVPRIETSMVGVDDALTTGASLSELEFTLVYSKASRRFRSDGSTTYRAANSVAVGVVTFTHGLTSRLDLTASSFVVSYSDEDERENQGRGLGDLFTDIKWHFHGDGFDGLQLAYRPGLSIPVGHEDETSAQSPGLGYWTINQALMATLLERRWVLGIEAGALLPVGDREGARVLAFGSVGVGHQVMSRVKPEIELNYLRDGFDDGPDSEALAVTAGVVINPTDSIRLDLGLRQGIWGENTDRSLTGSVNVSVSFGSGRPAAESR